MDTTQRLTILGWIVTFLLGLISALTVQRYITKKKIIGWSILGETELFSNKLAESFQIPVTVTVRGNQNTSLSAVQVRIGNLGNEVVEKMEVKIRFNSGCEILDHKLLTDVGAYKDYLSLISFKDYVLLKLEFINKAQHLDFDFLLGNYELGTVDVDFAAPGVEKRFKTATKWDVPEGIFRGLALNIAGIRYDPSVSPLNEIANELKALNSKLEKRI